MDDSVEIWRTSSSRTDWVKCHRTNEQLQATAYEWNQLAKDVQIISFVDAEQLPKISNPKELLGGVYWTGFLTDSDGLRYKFERLCSKDIKAKAGKKGMMWIGMVYNHSKRQDYLNGIYGRTSIDREKAAKEAFEHLKDYLAADKVASLIQLDEMTVMAEIISVLYDADENAKPPTKKQKEKKNQLDSIKKAYTDALCRICIKSPKDYESQETLIVLKRLLRLRC